MKIQDIAQKVDPENRVLGIVLDQDIAALLHEKLKIKKNDLSPEEWQELTAKVEAKIVEYFKNDNLFDAFRVEANSYIINRSFKKCATLAKP